MDTIMRVLDEEWSQLARSPKARGRMRKWGRQNEALAGHVDFEELLEARYAGAGAAHPILLGLARLAPTDELAARVLLQALVPGLVKLAATVNKDDPMASEELASIAWVRIRTYPAERLGSVAANVLLDTQKYYRVHRTIDAPRSLQLWEHDCEVVPSAEREAMSSLVMRDLLAARDRGLVSDRDLGLILRTRVADTALETIAAEREIMVHSLVVARSRAEQRLRAMPLAG